MIREAMKEQARLKKKEKRKKAMGPPSFLSRKSI
jgi:hypothetical protein